MTHRNKMLTIMFVVASASAIVVAVGQSAKDNGSARNSAYIGRVAVPSTKNMATLTLSGQVDLKQHRQPKAWTTEEEKQQWFTRNWRFADLWLARHERDVTNGLAPFLEDPVESLRARAARALGRLEAPGAEILLQEKLEQVRKAKNREEYEKVRGIPIQTLRLALGRIRARDLKGEAKLNKVAQSVDLTYEGVVQLTQQLEAKYKSKNPLERREAAQSQTKEISLEFVDLLHRMGKQGENLEALGAKRLAFGPAIEMRLKGGTLSLDQEIQLILDYAAQPGGAFDEAYLVELGPSAVEAILLRLEAMHREPKKYNLGVDGAVGHIHLFRAAAMTGDPRVIPLLKQIEADFKGDYQREQAQPSKSNSWTPTAEIVGFAQQSRRFAEEKSMFPVVPAY